MADPDIHLGDRGIPAQDDYVEQEGCLIRIFKRVVLGFLALIVIFSMLSNLLALPETIDTPSESDLGLNEDEIIDRYGQPDARSEIQAVSADRPIGLAPRRLTPGERYYSLSYEEGPLTLVFHFVSPETYQKYNGQRVFGEQWVVMERFIGTRNVVY
jgi:hypothetical protein